MDKYIFDESNGLWYERQGDYYIPCLTLPPEEEQSIGLWGQRHLRYIKEHRKALYTNLQLSGKLNSYLADIDQQAQDWLETIIQQMAQAQGVTEALKATNQMAWVDRMNNIRVSAMEIVGKELIYA
ncbi:MAG: TnpV protein [Subdoligranulum sp.]|nr:TnpV protein [Subdoligranulum sp.]MBD5101608.1 TnpV protein [Subdoligranulum sp.]